ncbi:methylated-DNA--[protein]-cysteine S-methyltransferase [Pseudosporangium ferrugineum]|uniref:methylated-DNA--[protein]-cysteine S-methyltransferase n=1 Tax=Pseudosporangium ferrugineum TaxID=439699 RepID=UPI003CCBF1B4
MRLLIETPIGPLGVELDAGTVIGVRFGASAAWAGDAGDGHRVLTELAGYFAGTVTDFGVPIELRGGSAFERAVWGQIALIPYGEMVTYGKIATALGDPGAARAVGTACNRNPIPVIVPCHRVVGAGGKLVGFGGGLPRKRQLLELEARVALERAWS